MAAMLYPSFCGSNSSSASMVLFIPWILLWIITDSCTAATRTDITRELPDVERIESVSRTTFYDPSFVRANIAFLSSRRLHYKQSPHGLNEPSRFECFVCQSSLSRLSV